MDAKRLMEQAAASLRAGQVADAEQALEKILRFQPAHVEAVRTLGRLQFETGRPEAAVATVRRASEAEPHNALFLEFLGDLQLRIDPAQAEQSARAALRIKPMSAPTHVLLGDALLAQQRFDDAMESYNFALRIRPEHPMPRLRLAEAQRLAGRIDEAEATLRAGPRDHPDLLIALGGLLAARERLDEAEAALRRAIEALPTYPPSRPALAKLLVRLERHEEAVQACHDAIRQNPNLAALHASLGDALVAAKRLEEAEAAYRRAIALEPRLMPARVAMLSVLEARGKLVDALAAAQELVRAAPRAPEAYACLGIALHALGRAEEGVGAGRRGWQLGGGPELGSNVLHMSNCIASLAPADALAAHRTWAQRYAAPLEPAEVAHTNDRDPDRRLRIGYVSPDFRAHAVSHFVEGLIRGHDRQHFEVFCYGSVSVPDAVTERFRAQADQWRDIAKTNDDAAAQLVCDDRIDILIDLAGHTSGHRLLVFARRPAPVQVTYQGYPNTTGLNQIQYRLTDALADPPGATDACYAERLIRLPRTGWCYQPPDPAPDVAPPPALSNGFATFGSFNRLSKVSPAIAQLWSRVVSAVPGSRFVFKTFGLEDPATAEYVRGMFKQHGLEPDRLILLPPAPSALAHLEMYAQMDVALDTYPYHGTTTTCEALWMGVPSIALVGPVHASRVSYSLLSSIGLADLAAQSPDEFVEAAARVAGDVPRLAELRRTMRDRMLASPLMDVASFCRDVEAAYRQMWRAWCESGG